MKILNKIENDDIAISWDEIANIRYEEINSGRDTTYNHILMPIFHHELKSLKPKKVLDAGCGLGFITKDISKFSKYVVGVDLSSRSIDMARQHNSSENIEYKCSSVEGLKYIEEFDVVISNMVLMDCVDHRSFLRACYKMLAPGGTLIATITNPNVWPRYWGYEKYSWFSYHSTIHILAEFQSSGAGKSGHKAIHTHRPLSDYLNAFSETGFEMLNISEITGSIVRSKIISKLPRYIKFKFTKTTNGAML
ncbi:MAG: class I SAM-dependent methyltransferase [Asticcacaulis sp.]|uniref:class I SAM-dependent methyltransferase n=1 Tax=Asticcacaulis sp. TaxID=1872648 RepID=UPI0025BB6B17|nr:class I SAM-dependent methyltransferase [Asticcacaulis sp.]MCA1936934.1 class I SAM-dependent methyltransferase [Asticcacaulis sp.]